MATALDRAGVRVTDARRAVADLVGEQYGHFTANDLVEAARARRMAVGRASIFRTIDLLVELNLVERLDLPSGEHAYVACEPAHHHHIVCSSCGRVSDVGDNGMTEVVRRVARETGYQVDTHRLELFGLCPECRRRRPS